MAIIYTPTTDGITLDETDGLQFLNSTDNTAGATDQDDTDVDVSTLPTDFATRLTFLGLDLTANSYADDIGVSTGTLGTVSNNSGTPITGINWSFTDGDSSGLDTLGGDDVLLYADPTNDDIILLLADDGGNDLGLGGTIIGAIYLVESADGTSSSEPVSAWLVLTVPLDHGTNPDPDDQLTFGGISLGIESILEFDFEGAPAGQNYFLALGEDSPTATQLIVTGKDPVDDTTAMNINEGDTINTSKGGGPTTAGSNNQMLNPDEGLHIRFVNGQDSDNLVPNLDQNEADVESNIDFDGFASSSGAGVQIAQTQPGGGPKSLATVSISAFKAEGLADTQDGTNYAEELDDDLQVDILRVDVFRDGTLIYSEEEDGTVLDNDGLGVDVTFSGNTAEITGIKADDQIFYVTDGLHDHMLVENTGTKNTADFDIGKVFINDSEGDTEPVNNIHVDDDGPSLTISDNSEMVIHDETPGVDNDGETDHDDDTDVLLASLPSGLQTLFGNVTGGDDPDVSGTGPIGYAASAAAIVDVTASDSGADGWDGGGVNPDITYAISTTDQTDSGLETTEGTSIFLYNGTGSLDGLILGRVGTEGTPDTPDDTGAIAFAIAIDEDTGIAYTQQWLSVTNPTAGDGTNGSHDEPTAAIADDAIIVSATATDDDGDDVTSTASANDTFKFQDDGPTVSATDNGTMVIHDETGGVDNDGTPVDDDVAGTTVVDLGGDEAPGGGDDVTIAALFNGLTGTGNDPHVGEDATSTNNAIGYARSGGSLLTVTATSGADGWDGGTEADATSYALDIPIDGTASGLSTTDGTEIFLYASGDLIVGRVGTEGGGSDDTALANGTIAFAIAIDADSGELFTSQWLSVESSSPGDGTTPAGSHDETDALDDTALQIVVSVKDDDNDTKSFAVDVGDNVGFQDDGPSLSGVDDGGPIEFKAGESDTDSFTFLAGSDGPKAVGDGGVQLVDFIDPDDATDAAAFTASGLEALQDLVGDIDAIQVGNTVTYYIDEGADDGLNLTELFVLEVEDDNWLFTISEDPPLILRPIDISIVEPGAPTESETLTGTTGGGKTVIFDGLYWANVTDPSDLLDGDANFPTDPIDDINTNQQGFGIKNDQASQINNLEGFRADFEDSGGTPDALGGFSFDIEGIGNIKSIDIHWATLDDTGAIKDTGTATVALPSGNNEVQFLIQEGATTGQIGDVYTVGVSSEFEGVVIQAITPDGIDSEDPKDWNDGVRFLNFSTLEPVPIEPITLSFDVKGTDGDDDMTQTETFDVVITEDGLAPTLADAVVDQLA